MGSTLPSAVLATMVAAQLSATPYEPIQQISDRLYSSQSTAGTAQFTPEYVISDHQLIKVVPALINEVSTVDGLAEIGGILFKDSRGLTGDEKAVVRAYYKKKYSKI